MEQLVEKINNHTASGPPSVSELIELQELARDLKIPRSTLEKMIAEAISLNSVKEVKSVVRDLSVDEPSYERLNYDSARNSFDAEMNQRRETESIPERKEIEFNRPEIVFPKMEDPFSDRKKEVDEQDSDVEATSELLFDSEIPIENFDFEIEPFPEFVVDPVESVNNISEEIQEIEEMTAELEKTSKEKMDQVQELMNERQEEALAYSQRAIEDALQSHGIEKQKNDKKFEQLKAEAKAKYRNDFKDETTKQVEQEEKKELERLKDNEFPHQAEIIDEAGTSEGGLIDLVEAIKESKGGTIEFESAVENLETTVNSINDETEQYVQKESNSYNDVEEFEKSDTVVRKKEIDAWIANSNKEERNRAEEITQRNLQANTIKKKRSFERDGKEYGVPSKFESVKAAYALGVVALIVSILFGFVGGIIGIVGIGKANNGLRKIEVNPKSFEPGALSKLKNARTMAIISIVISAVKFFRLFYFGYYFF